MVIVGSVGVNARGVSVRAPRGLVAVTVGNNARISNTSSFLAGGARSHAYACLNIQTAQTFRETYSSFFFFSYKYSSPLKLWVSMDLKFVL